VCLDLVTRNFCLCFTVHGLLTRLLVCAFNFCCNNGFINTVVFGDVLMCFSLIIAKVCVFFGFVSRFVIYLWSRPFGRWCVVLLWAQRGTLITGLLDIWTCIGVQKENLHFLEQLSNSWLPKNSDLCNCLSKDSISEILANVVLIRSTRRKGSSIFPFILYCMHQLYQP
jgi:hypothetical protein